MQHLQTKLQIGDGNTLIVAVGKRLDRGYSWFGTMGHKAIRDHTAWRQET
jgi:hypothetical protein